MIRFSEMPYERPDIEGLKAAVEEATRKVREAKSAAEVRDAYFALQEKETVSDTLYSLAYVRNTIDTNDAFYEGEIKWLQAAFAEAIPQFNAWKKALAESPFRGELETEFGKQLFRKIDAGLMTSDERIIAETIREGELRQAYQKVTAVASTDFRGEKCNFYGLLKHMESTDRAERKEAFEAWAALYEQISGTLEEQYGEMVRVIFGQRVDLVAGFRTVEIDFPVFLTVPVVHGNAVGIAVLPVQGKNAPLFLLQDPKTFFFADLLLKSPHRPEHASSSFPLPLSCCSSWPAGR